MLVNRTQIATYNQISKSLDENVLNQYIETAEIVMLKPLLGELLYNDLAANKTDSKYVDLLEGTVYTYEEYNYKHEGLIPVLSHFVYSQYILFSSDVATPFGMVNKTNPNSQNVDFKHKQTISKAKEQIGYTYFEAVRDFLNRNKDIYPLWCKGEKKRKFNFNKITR